MYCRKCGHPIQSGDRFCGGCGAAVDQEPTQEGSRGEEKLELKEEVVYNSLDHADGETVPPAQGQKFTLIFDDPQQTEDYIAPKEDQEQETPVVLGESEEPVQEAEITDPPIDFSEFSWNVQDFPKPKKVEEIDFRWHDPDKVDITLREAGEPAGTVSARDEGQAAEKPTASVRQETLLEYETEPDISYDVTSVLANETPAEKEARIRELEEEIFGEALSAAPEETVSPAEKAASASVGTVEKTLDRTAPAADPVPMPIFQEPIDEARTVEEPTAEEPLIRKPIVEETVDEEPVADAIGDDDIERFFTFSKKNEEFQKLLDREYEKIQKRDAEQGQRKEAAPETISLSEKAPAMGEDPVLARDTKPVELRKIMESQPASQAVPSRGPVDEPLPKAAATENQGTEPKSPAPEDSKPSGEARSGRMVGFNSEQIDEMAAARASFFGSAMPSDQEELPHRAPTLKREEDTEALEELEKEIFGEALLKEQYHAPGVEPAVSGLPAQETAERSGGGAYELRTADLPSGDRRETKKRKLGMVGVVILAIVIAILAIEAAMLGIKYFAPQSPAAIFVEKIQSGIMAVFHKEEAPIDKPEETTATIEELIYRQRGNNYGEDNGNIREIRENADLKFDPGLDYGIPDLNASTPIRDNYWLTDANGIIYNFDATAVGTVIAFDSRWVEYMNTGDNAVFNFLKTGTGAYEKALAFENPGKTNATFKLLEIGEIRQGTTGFYVWTHELISIAEDGVETPEENYRIYYVEPDGSAFRVIDYYAFNQ